MSEIKEHLSHTHTSDDGEDYTHTHVDPTCTHRWRDCPVHGKPDGQLPPMRIAMTCIYGGAETKDGGTWTRATSDLVVDRIATRLKA